MLGTLGEEDGMYAEDDVIEAAAVAVVLTAEGMGARVVGAEVIVVLSEVDAAAVLLSVAVAWPTEAQPLPVGGASARVSIVVTYLPGLGISRLLLS